MNTKIKIFLAVLLLIAVFNRKKILGLFGLNPAQQEAKAITIEKNEVQQADEAELQEEPEALIADYPVNDTLFRWDRLFFDWVPTKETLAEYEQRPDAERVKAHSVEGPIEINWETLTDIRYRLQYFSEMEMEILAPVYPKGMKALDGKEVIIEGFVIPFDPEQELLSLSANPFAACFFCGKASPASVLSMYLKNEGKRYKMDARKTFRGILELNYGDPNQFYYILKNAEEE